MRCHDVGNSDERHCVLLILAAQAGADFRVGLRQLYRKARQFDGEGKAFVRVSRQESRDVSRCLHRWASAIWFGSGLSRTRRQSLNGSGFYQGLLLVYPAGQAQIA